MLNPTSKAVFDVDYFLDKFSKIPRRKWATGTLKKNNRSCALAHTGCTNNYMATEETLALHKLLVKLPRTNVAGIVYYHFPHMNTISMINDGHVLEYQHWHPKRRILAALKDYKKLFGSSEKQQQPLYEDIRKELLKNIEIGDGVDQPVKEIVNV